MLPDDGANKPTAWSEARLLVNLAVPTVVVQLGAVIPPVLTASYIGRHLGSVYYLDGFTLASLTGNLLTLSLLQGLYSASDTLSPQAFGVGNFREVGLLAIRGFAWSLILLVPINLILVRYLESLLIWVGQDLITAGLAAQWYRIYAIALPFYALFNVTWKFLSAQEIMAPLVFVMLLSGGIILPLALETLVPWIGFTGSAMAVVLYYTSQVGMLLFYLAWKQPHHASSWPGLHAWREALAWKPFLAYMKLGSGGMLAASEWWYWEVLSLMIGTFGVLPLSVHTVATQVLTVSFMFPLGIGIALSIRVGATLPRSVTRAKQLVLGCYVVGSTFFAIMAGVLYLGREGIFRIFTNDERVLEGCERIWWKVVVYFFNLSIFGLNMGLASGLGMQWTLGIVNTFFLWVVGLPAVYVFAVVCGGGLDTAWAWVYPPYIFMNAGLLFAFFSADWYVVAKAIRKREGVEEGGIETTVGIPPRYGSTDEESNLLTR